MSVLEFVWAVLTYWQAYMTGGIVAAVLFIYERKTQKNVPVQWVLWGALAFLLVGCFMAWRDERSKVVDQKKETEKLRSQLDDLSRPNLKPAMVMLIGESEGSVMFTLIGSIQNQGADSVVNHIGILLDTAEGPLPVTPIVFEEGTNLHLPAYSGDGISFKYKSLAEQVAEHPIERGGQRVGQMVFMARGVSLDRYYRIRKRERLTFEDITGKVYNEPLQQPSTGLDPRSIPYIPGTKIKPFSSPSPDQKSRKKNQNGAPRYLLSADTSFI